MSRKFWVAASLLALLAFAIPIEHKYDKLFRFFSLKLIPQGLEISKQYDKKIYFYVSDLISLNLIFLGLFVFKIPVKRFFGHPLWIVFLCALFSIIASPFAFYPVAYCRLLQLLTPIALFSFLANAFSVEERALITRILFFSLLAAALFQSVVAIAQYFNEGPLGLRLLGESNTPSTIAVQDGSRWILDNLFGNSPTRIAKIRAAGTFPHANVLGGFLVFTLLITYALTTLVPKRKTFLLLSLPLQFFALCLTFSRAALFAWGIGTIVWFALVFWNKGWENRSIQRLGMVLLLLVTFCGALLSKQMLDRGGIFNYNSISKGSDSVRLFHQNLSWKIMKDHPLFGLGFAQFSERSQKYFSSEVDTYTRSTGPHNIFLFLACETGLISLMAFLLSLSLLANQAFQSAFTIEKATLIASLAAFLFIGCCDYYPILFQQGKLIFFLILGLLAAHAKRKPFELKSEMV